MSHNVPPLQQEPQTTLQQSPLLTQKIETSHPDVHEPTTAATDHALESLPYSTFYLLNVEGLSPQAKSQSKWKIPILSGSLLNAPDSSGGDRVPSCRHRAGGVGQFLARMQFSTKVLKCVVIC